MTTLLSVSEMNISSKTECKEVYFTNKFYNNATLTFVRNEPHPVFGIVKVMKSKTDNVGRLWVTPVFD